LSRALFQRSSTAAGSDEYCGFDSAADGFCPSSDSHKISVSVDAVAAILIFDLVGAAATRAYRMQERNN